MDNRPIRVLLAEDHTVTRLGIKMFLEGSKDIVVVGEASNGEQAVQKGMELNPDVVLMDVMMPQMDGIEAARKLREHDPQIKIVMMTSSKDEKDVFGALSAGASGYCTKDVSDDRLLTAIMTVVRGDVWLDSAVAAKLLQVIPTQTSAQAAPGAALSERELEVLRLIVDGHNNTAIAKTLFISGDTVKSHVKHILEKLAVSDRTQAAVKALREGLL